MAKFHSITPGKRHSSQFQNLFSDLIDEISWTPKFKTGDKVLVEDYDCEWRIIDVRKNILGKYEYHCYHSIGNCEWRSEAELKLC